MSSNVTEKITSQCPAHDGSKIEALVKRRPPSMSLQDGKRTNPVDQRLGLRACRGSCGPCGNGETTAAGPRARERDHVAAQIQNNVADEIQVRDARWALARPESNDAGRIVVCRAGNRDGNAWCGERARILATFLNQTQAHETQARERVVTLWVAHDSPPSARTAQTSP